MQLLHFLNDKNASLYHQGKKSMRLTWTTAWRRLNKKVRVDAISKRRVKRRVRMQKAVIGLSLDDLRKKRAQKPAIRKLQAAAVAQEVKERKKVAATKPAAKVSAKQPQQPKQKFSKKGAQNR